MIAMSSQGILLIDKPEGITSRQVDNHFQHLFHTRKVGHLGTLDPFATGLLIVAINEATKYMNFLPDEEKTYHARLVLGKATDSGDKTGQVIEEKPVPSLSEEKVNEVFKSFLGKGSQIPPMTSAIKVDGTALYKLAHQGKEIDREPRPIEIFKLNLLELKESEILFSCRVSKGTYIRVLGEDIAKALGTVGYLESLRRTAVGNVKIEQAIPLEKASQIDLLDPADYVEYKNIEVNDEVAKKVSNGVKLSFDTDEERVLIRYEGKALAVYEKEGEIYRCLRGLSSWK